MLGHYTTPPVSLSIPIGWPHCQRTGIRAVDERAALEPHLAPFAATGVPGAGPQYLVGDVDDDTSDRAVVQIALRRMMFADRTWVIGVIGHEQTQSPGVDSAPVALDKRFYAGLTQPRVEKVFVFVELGHPGHGEVVGVRQESVAARAHRQARHRDFDVVEIAVVGGE